DSPARSHFNFFFPPQMFYSRRIGRAPQGTIAADFVAAPSETTILGAVKLTGKMGNGGSAGAPHPSPTPQPRLSQSGAIRGRQQVEPMTNYLVSRVTKEAGDSR